MVPSTRMLTFNTGFVVRISDNEYNIWPRFGRPSWRIKPVPMFLSKWAIQIPTDGSNQIRCLHVCVLWEYGTENGKWRRHDWQHKTPPHFTTSGWVRFDVRSTEIWDEVGTQSYRIYYQTTYHEQDCNGKMSHWIIHTIQRLMLSKGAKRTIFYNITVSLQYCWDKTIARSDDMYRDASGLFSLVIKRFGNTNTSVQNFDIRISSVKTVPKCLRKLKVFGTNLV